MITTLIDVLKGKHSFSFKRSSKWPKIREEHLKNNPTCALCGGKEKLEVHHIQPFHVKPELELELNNLITLCESKNRGINCHLFIGHLGNYKLINVTALEDAKFWSKKLNKIKS